MEAAVFQVWIYLQTQMGLLRARLSPVFGDGAPGWSSRPPQETQAPLAPGVFAVVCSAAVSNGC